MSAGLIVRRAGPLVTVQDAGRPGALRYGIAGSGPMDRAAFARAGGWLGGAASAGLEVTRTGVELELETGTLGVAGDGGGFVAMVNGQRRDWPMRVVLKPGDRLDISPGDWGNYGYLRFDAELDLPSMLGSCATNATAGLGGLEGRALIAGDRLRFGDSVPPRPSTHPRPVEAGGGAIRVMWGLHADLFPAELRDRFLSERFVVSQRLDRMGVGLDDPGRVFAGWTSLSLVSDAIVPGDIQIVGDGAPTVLMRDHQPVGGYPRIATVISADLDRFAQLRPGSDIRFEAVSPDHARRIVEETRR